MSFVNLFQKHLKKLEKRLKPKTFKRLTFITEEFSRKYLENRSNIELRRIKSEFRKLYSADQVYRLPIDLEMTDAETRQFNALRATLSPSQVREIANAGYTVYSYGRRNTASKKAAIRDFSLPQDEAAGLAHLHRCNDYGAAAIMHSLLENAGKGENHFHVGDIGAGTGGTLESLVHHAWLNAKRTDLDLSRLKFTFTSVEQNPKQVEMLEKKIHLLKKHYGGLGLQFDVNVVPKDAISAINSLTHLDGAIATFSIHHLHDADKQILLGRLHNSLKSGATFAYNDCDGHSDYNKQAYNFLNLAHLSVFDTKKQAKQMLEKTGFNALTLLSNSIARAVSSKYPDCVEKSKADEKTHRAFFLYGVKR